LKKAPAFRGGGLEKAGALIAVYIQHTQLHLCLGYKSVKTITMCHHWYRM